MAIRLRSLLFTPGTRPNRFARAAEVGADAIIIDLEDSVSHDDKALARHNAFSIPVESTTLFHRAVRINSLGSKASLYDLRDLAETDLIPDLVVIPKVESPACLEWLDRLLSEVGASTQLIALIESCRGLAALPEIVRGSTRLCALMLGAADLSADFGCAVSAPNITSAKIELVAASALEGISAIDSPYFDLADTGGFAADVDLAKAMGFSGKAAIHPHQIELINKVFMPTESDIEHAQAVIAVNQAGVGSLDGHMIDEAVARQARRVLAAAGHSLTQLQ